MKILKRIEDDVVIYATNEEITISDSESVITQNGQPCHDQWLNSSNAVIEEISGLPPKFSGACYSYNSGVWTCVNQAFIDELFPVPTISMRQARLKLLEMGLLDDVELAMSGMPKADQIEWEYAVEVKRDYPLVLQLAGALNMNESDMDLFFESAKLI